ncbi:MAG: TonB-dependent receptor plug domain-containing protein, partial [Campylobacteraceae bacterium]|nr:TonB-dependent receptor plug domain-containing protein [Campylobacteraceae bacterium]
MSLFRGFKGKYFSLAAILALNAGTVLAANNVSLDTTDDKVRQNLSSEKESETDTQLIEASQPQVATARLPVIHITKTLKAIEAKNLQEQTSSRTTQNKSDTTDNTHTITSEEIELKGYKSLSEALNSLGGTGSTANGGAGQSSSIYLRGFNPAHTLVLVDGVRVNDVSGLSGAQSELIDLYGVEKIELLKGAQSGVWGSDSDAGVVNIITKPTPQGIHANALAEYGSSSWQKYATSLSYANEVFDIAASLGWSDTKGISAAAPKKGQSGYGERDDGYEKDGFTQRSFQTKGGVYITPD